MRVSTKLAGMVLAAGLGTRLRPLTYLRAKPAVPFLGRPLIRHVLDLVRQAGAEEVVVNLHHLPDTIRRAAAGFGGDLFYSFEDPILGTAGALGKVRDRLAGKRILLVNGKIYFEENLRDVVEWHTAQKALATLVLVPRRPGSPFSPVYRDPEGWIRAFGGVPSGDSSSPRSGSRDENSWQDFVFTGVHVLEPEVLECIPDGPSDSVRDLYPRLMARGNSVAGYVSHAFWCESSTPERYVDNSFTVLGRHRGLLDSETGSRESFSDWSGSRVIQGENCRVAPGSKLDRVILWDGVEILDAISARNVVFTDGVTVSGDGGRFENVVVTPRTVELERVQFPECRIEGDTILWPFNQSG